MEDDHVDRLDVQVRQRAELTSTNRSIGLIALMIRVRINTPHTMKTHGQPKRLPQRKMLAGRTCLAGLVVRAGCLKPDPISNSAVNRPSAHGTVS